MKLRQQDIDRVVAALPLSVLVQLQRGTSFLAGGFVRDVIAGRQPRDIDIFGESEDLLEIAEELQYIYGGKLEATKNTKTWRPESGLPVQLVTGLPVTSPAALLARFNFSVNQAVVWYDRIAAEWFGICDEDFYADLAARRLVPKAGINPATSLVKMVMFLNEGWVIDSEGLMKIVGYAAARHIYNADAQMVTDCLLASLNEGYECSPREIIVLDAHSNSPLMASSTTSRARATMAYTF